MYGSTARYKRITYTYMKYFSRCLLRINIFATRGKCTCIPVVQQPHSNVSTTSGIRLSSWTPKQKYQRFIFGVNTMFPSRLLSFFIQKCWQDQTPQKCGVSNNICKYWNFTLLLLLHWYRVRDQSFTATEHVENTKYFLGCTGSSATVALVALALRCP